MTVPWKEGDDEKHEDSEEDMEDRFGEETLKKENETEEDISCSSSDEKNKALFAQKNYEKELATLNFEYLPLLIEISSSELEQSQYLNTSITVTSIFLAGIISVTITFLYLSFMLLDQHIKRICKPHSRENRKYCLSEYPVDDIRYYVSRFLKDNLTFGHYLSKKSLNSVLERPKLNFHTLYTVYPAHTLGEYFKEVESNPGMSFRERMQYDMFRTSTYSQFPRTSPVSSLMLAKAGFYYEGKADEVKCFKCGKTYRNWKRLDDPIQIHKEISPSCPFVSSLECGFPTRNVASANNSNVNDESILYRREDEQRNTNYRYETGNGSSTTGHESVLISDISQNAQYTCNGVVSNQGQAYGINGENNVLSSSESRAKINSVEINCHNTNVAHSQRSVDEFSQRGLSTTTNESTSSSYRQQSGNINLHTCGSNNVPNESNVASSQYVAVSSATNLTASSNATSHSNPKSATSTLEPLGISIEKPRYPQYAVHATRISSFRSWPEHLRQRPEELAKAGFLYEGTNDFTRCFFCAGGLRDWEPEDNPCIEHARWYKNCVFVRQCKGEDFVNLVHQGKIQEAMSKLEGRTVHKEKHLDDILKSTAALSVQEMGYSIDIVRKAILSHTKSHEGSNITADSLLQCVWELEEGHNIDQGHDLPNNDVTENIEGTALSESTHDSRTETTEDLLAENRQLKEQHICKICMDEEISIVFLPCGHMATCVNCAPAVRKCPLCRRFIRGTVKAILS